MPFFGFLTSRKMCSVFQPFVNISIKNQRSKEKVERRLTKGVLEEGGELVVVQEFVHGLDDLLAFVCGIFHLIFDVSESSKLLLLPN